jgi:signal peptidase I
LERRSDDKKKESGESRESLLAISLSLGVLVILVFAFKWSVLDANNIPSGSMIPTLKIGDYLFVNKMRFSFRIPYTEIDLFHIDDPIRGDVVTFIPPPPGDSGKHYVKRVIGLPGDRIRIRNLPACLITDPAMSDHLESISAQDREKSEYCRELPAFREPQYAFVEFRPSDRGPWLNFSPKRLPDQEEQTLLDADNSGVLPSRYYGGEMTRAFDPRVFEESVSGKSYRIVETPEGVEAYAMCDAIETAGCLIPENFYLMMGDNRDDSKDSRFIGLIDRGSILGKTMIIYFSINWRDEICSGYYNLFREEERTGFLLPDFSPEDQKRYCTHADAMTGYETFGGYLSRTLLNRIPRMSVRWYRIGDLIR